MDLDDVLDAILANALELLHGVGGSVMLLEDQSMLRVVAVRGEGIDRDARIRWASRSPAASRETREPLLVSGVGCRCRRRCRLLRPAATSRSAARCASRWSTAASCSACSTCWPARATRFDEDDLAVLSLFAEPVAAAIAKAGSLRGRARRNVAKLLESDRMKSQFVASVSHELRTPDHLDPWCRGGLPPNRAIRVSAMSCSTSSIASPAGSRRWSRRCSSRPECRRARIGRRCS